jgi:hypothetical protein
MDGAGVGGYTPHTTSRRSDMATTRLEAKKRRYMQDQTRLNASREDYYAAIVAEFEGNEDTPGKSVRALARETGLTYGRIGQIVRGE